MSNINVRSPHYITTGTVTGLNSTAIEIYIYTGARITDRPSTPTYNLEGFAVNNEVTFEIGELVKDYVSQTFDGTYATSILWVDYRTTQTINGVAQTISGYTYRKAFNGYGYFEDGANPQNNSAVYISNDIILKLDDSPVVFAVDNSITASVAYLLNGEIVRTINLTQSSLSTEQIRYVTNGVNGADSFEDRVISDGGSFEDNICIQGLEDEFILMDCDSIHVTYSDGTFTRVKILKVQNVEECKYEPYKVTFVNKFGALQDIWFFKRSDKTLTTKKESFKRNIVSGASYSINKHQDTLLTKQGSEKITLNTGYYPEDYNEVFKQLELSEECWIEIDFKTLPINIASTSLAYKTHLNDKIINYTIEVEFANNTINDIR